jgi:hypothetical protein
MSTDDFVFGFAMLLLGVMVGISIGKIIWENKR